jgi:DNA-binding transcriptional ArsR family regulator
MSNHKALAALGSPVRLALFERLRRGPLAVVDLARGLPISRPAVSQHLRVLKEAGLVTERAEGAKNLYAIHPGGIAALRAWVDELWDTALGRFKAALEAQEPARHDDLPSRADPQVAPPRGPDRPRPKDRGTRPRR